jgi:segregation and condensation protein B
MNHPEANPASPSEPDDRTPSSAPLSVDQLTQAFAQLMGEQPIDARAVGVVAESARPDEQPGEYYQTAADEAEAADADGGQVTPAAILEAVLFVGHPHNEPLTSRRIASYLRGVSPQEVDALIEQLNRQYDEQRAPYEIVSVGAGYRMTLRRDFQRLRDTFYGRVRQAKLSQVAVDLLAIVAYHQPITREDVDRLRGQPSGATLAQLVRRQLLEVEHTTERPRRKIYRTTDRFLELFGLESLEDLPSHEDF